MRVFAGQTQEKQDLTQSVFHILQSLPGFIGQGGTDWDSLKHNYVFR